MIVCVYIGYLCYRYITALQAFNADVEVVRQQIARQAEQEGFWNSVTYVPVAQGYGGQAHPGAPPGMQQPVAQSASAGAPRAQY